MLDLLGTLYASAGSWRAVAALLGKYDGAMWAKIANGKRPATFEQRNLVLRASGLPEETHTPLQIVAQSNVQTVFVLSGQPNAAALFTMGGGDLVRARFEVGELADGEAATVSVTACHKAQVKRRGRKPILSLSLKNLSAESPETERGNTGDLPRISNAAMLAKRFYDSVPTESELRLWLRVAISAADCSTNVDRRIVCTGNQNQNGTASRGGHCCCRLSSIASVLSSMRITHLCQE